MLLLFASLSIQSWNLIERNVVISSKIIVPETSCEGSLELSEASYIAFVAA